MPVKHDLYADLSVSKDDLAKRRGSDPRLNQLVAHYDEIDAEVLKAEAGSSLGVSDGQLLKLKGKRLETKDKIVSQLSHPQ
ncbi:DUF465 domain-containing protein [Pseudomonas huanghezhanensis]|uniref:DUF465 domain-containing protein n=1 Tax=Pseudomonas huanghezhanensis TaxID=3002903 RepID=UPI002286330D|nr:DUF465 domain-containing protein [Pseudomonas sp. BSw22131]